MTPRTKAFCRTCRHRWAIWGTGYDVQYVHCPQCGGQDLTLDAWQRYELLTWADEIRFQGAPCVG